VTAAEVIAALDIPPGARVDRRVPKKLLVENGAPTAADRRHISEGIEELAWLAALKPTSIGVPEYRDEVCEYLEINVLRLTLRPGARAGRLIELAHRAVPYPVLLVGETAEGPSVSAAHKRWSQGEAAKTVLDDEVTLVEWNEAQDSHWRAFLEALPLGRQPRTTLRALYQGWMDALLALQAAEVTGAFGLAETPERAALRREALQEYRRLETEMARLRAAADRERQLPRQVDLNLELQRLRAAQAEARGKL
jgi:hypothetical protein